MQDTNELLAKILDEAPQVSDLIFSPGRSPLFRVDGILREVPKMEELTETDISHLTAALTGARNELHRQLQSQGHCDFSYSISGQSRFRVNIFMQRGTCAIVMRVIPRFIPAFDKLGLPKAVSDDVIKEKKGLVLITGPTGSGKSWTLAAILGKINREKAYHIVTIEDPVEFLHAHDESTIHQRELHSDTPSFSQALRSAMRQSPDVIVVSEIRDRETMEIVLEAAETGHLIFSTVHTNDSAKTVERILGLFPNTEQPTIRTRLANSFQWIISQRLVPMKEGAGRKVVVEILRSTQRTREYVERGESEGKSLLDAIRDGANEGMQYFDADLARLAETGLITTETAINYATNPNDLKLRLSGLTEGRITGLATSNY